MRRCAWLPALAVMLAGCSTEELDITIPDSGTGVEAGTTTIISAPDATTSDGDAHPDEDVATAPEEPAPVDDAGDEQDEVEVSLDAGPLSFATDVYPIMTARCIACHTPQGTGVTMGHLDMTTGLASGAYSQLINVRAMGTVPGAVQLTCAMSDLIRVVPSSGATSLLYNKVNSKLLNMPALCGNTMPAAANAPPLTADQVATIKAWIDEGANP